ncbi:RidA family protein [Rhodopseudomonas sp. P2A-2r]|uniref:RidA family protein n=1 Tax=unclassified Rhodopseudomonas TaxID=2638247 RepID=UPI002234139D|nr:RidA family protein [Rhodopseudomonas sp. P2A-2r]UZE50820.1 RidA family protein [Rhodopseudomonas sp. P2A-2r]
MTKKIIIATSKAPAAAGPYSQAVRTGNLVFCAGQLPMDLAGVLPATIEEQTHLSLKNVAAVLEAGGASLASAVKTTVFLKDMNDFAAMNAVYATYFPENPPARSTVEVARLPKDALVEIEAIAISEG